MSPLALPPKLDLASVGPLAEEIRARQGDDLILDASAVTQLGALGLQVLASAALSWRGAGHDLTVTPRSESFDRALKIFGVKLDDLQSDIANPKEAA